MNWFINNIKDCFSMHDKVCEKLEKIGLNQCNIRDNIYNYNDSPRKACDFIQLEKMLDRLLELTNRKVSLLPDAYKEMKAVAAFSEVLLSKRQYVLLYIFFMHALYGKSLKELTELTNYSIDSLKKRMSKLETNRYLLCNGLASKIPENGHSEAMRELFAINDLASLGQTFYDSNPFWLYKQVKADVGQWLLPIQKNNFERHLQRIVSRDERLPALQGKVDELFGYVESVSEEVMNKVETLIHPYHVSLYVEQEAQRLYMLYEIFCSDSAVIKEYTDSSIKLWHEYIKSGKGYTKLAKELKTTMYQMKTVIPELDKAFSKYVQEHSQNN